MAGNQSSSSPAGAELRRGLSYYVFLQVLIGVFLAINLFLLGTLLGREQFRLSMRYVLFANMLLNDCWFLVVSDVLLLHYHFGIAIRRWLCMGIYLVQALSNRATACTLTAMTLERYVAVCVPLRHAELCCGRRSLGGVAVIGGLSSVPGVVFFLAVSASVGRDYFERRLMCTVHNLEAYPWHNHLRSAVFAAYFLAMGGVIVFCYVRIMRAAKAARARERAASRRGLGTVSLHAVQLVLCLMQLLLPPFEKALAEADRDAFQIVRLFNYVAVTLSPRCLSPLVYGLRDETFFKALKSYALCRFSGKNWRIEKRQKPPFRRHASSAKCSKGGVALPE
ncbi:odorant receptor 131-2-like [Hippocampus zosterae]|uniref:odorant receptor 131-2-like n=1 Tax=Hippocampus zosterae TaxID=109293 RepID=UPI00223CD4BB|nr:odorant receptor 131-2-like [Hippocampus zosterae]